MKSGRRAIATLSSILALGFQTACAAADELEEQIDSPPAAEISDEQLVETDAPEPESREQASPDEARSVSRNERRPSASTSEASRQAASAQRGSSPTRSRTKPEQKAASGRDRQSQPTSSRPGERRDSPRRRNTPEQGSSAASMPHPASSGSNGGYGAFRIITERNIFDSSRTRRASKPPRESRRAAPAETLTLVGTLSYEKGSFAFFDGSKSESKKVLALGTAIADHRIVGISSGAVTLQADTNTFELRVGGQLRRENDRWLPAAGDVRVAARPGANAEPAGVESPPDSESAIIKRLMEQREQQLR